MLLKCLRRIGKTFPYTYIASSGYLCYPTFPKCFFFFTCSINVAKLCWVPSLYSSSDIKYKLSTRQAGQTLSVSTGTLFHKFITLHHMVIKTNNNPPPKRTNMALNNELINNNEFILYGTYLIILQKCS